MTNLEMRQFAASEDLAAIRRACGIVGARIARAIGVPPCVIYQYEAGTKRPVGQQGARYLRIMLALRNHLEAEADDADGERECAA